MNGLDLFSGIGGISFALQPWARTVCYVEIEPYCQAVLRERIGAGDLANAPIWDDIATFNPGPFAGAVDIISGGFPCQDISTASHGRGGGFNGEHTGLWREFRRIIRAIHPGLVFIENIARWRAWVPDVRRDLHAIGYASVPLQLSAAEVGAPHKGERIYLIAAPHGHRQSISAINAEASVMQKVTEFSWEDWRETPPGALGVADGIPHRVERLKGLGNAVVPQAAREAFQQLIGHDEDGP